MQLDLNVYAGNSSISLLIIGFLKKECGILWMKSVIINYNCSVSRGGFDFSLGGSGVIITIRKIKISRDASYYIFDLKGGRKMSPGVRTKNLCFLVPAPYNVQI